MPTELKLTALDADAVAFELDSFEPTDDGRLEVRGRWSGVRGRRFVRPTLTIATWDTSVRLLADLEHKPWLPDEGRSWLAAFPWDVQDAEIVEASLAVTPDIEVVLPAPGADVPKRSASPTDGADLLIRALREREGELERLRGQLERTESAVHSAVSERNETVAATAREREHWQRERDALLGERSRLVVEQKRWTARCDSLAKEVSRLKRELAKAAAERDAAFADRDALRRPRAPVVDTPAPAIEPPATAIEQPARLPSRRSGVEIHWLPRALALALLAAVILALALVVRIL